MPQLPHNAKDIFLAALDRAEPADRAIFVTQACSGDDTLRRHVEALLSAHDEPDRLLDQPRIEHDVPLARTAGGAAIAQSLAEQPGTKIGPYKLLEVLGEGGMGVVYLADQSAPVERRVALKIIKPGMDSVQVIARFEAERQALAMMDHVNIARVLDVGTTQSGRPYFVMELVRGVPITRYCDDHRLSPRQRLELFVPVCQAIQHAHQKGIIHRDIKPSNVMVTLYDGRPVPKVIDFGVAKATEQRLTEQTLFTQHGTLIGTLEYMSPEQAELNGQGVDTRSDVFSLGVLLYELLTGGTPLSLKRVRAAAYGEVLRLIKEEEPQKPSARLSDSGEALASISAQRHTEPSKLAKLMRGELDWIVMKTLEKDRNRRYETANALAADVQRYLSDEPVQACPPSAAYRFGKFARRNKGALAIVVVLALATLLAGGTLGWAARDRQIQQSVLEREVFLGLEESTQWQNQDKWPEARAAVMRAEGLLAGGKGSPALEQRVAQRRQDLEMVSTVQEVRLQRSGVRNDAFDAAQADAGYALAFRQYGVDVIDLNLPEAATRLRARSVALELARALDDWTVLRRNLASGANQGWEKLLAVAVEIDPDPWRNRFRQALQRKDRAALTTLAASDEIARLPASTLCNLGAMLIQTGAVEEAVALMQQAQRRYPSDFWVNQELAAALRKTSPPRYGEASRYLMVARALRPDSPGVHLNLGVALCESGFLDEGIRMFREAVRLEPTYGAAHNNLGAALTVKGELVEAVAALRESVRLRPHAAQGHCNLGKALFVQDKPDEAIEALREALRLQNDLLVALKILGEALQNIHRLDEAAVTYRQAIQLDPSDAITHVLLGRTLQDLNREDEAIAAFREAIRLGLDDAVVYYNLGNMLLAKKSLDEAISAYREALRLQPSAPQTWNNLGLALQGKGLLDEAIDGFREAIRLQPDHANAHNNLGNTLRMKGRTNEAIVVLRQAILLDPTSASAHSNLGAALRAEGSLEEAIGKLREAIRLQPDLAEAHSNLGNALKQQGHAAEALVALREAIRLQPDLAEAHCNLGLTLRSLGQYAEALAALQRGHELGSRRPHWTYPSARWLKDCQHLAELEVRLPAVLQGENDLSAAEHLEFAQVCQAKRLQLAAAKLYQTAFDQQPEAVAHPQSGHRYQAACSAAQVSCGTGQDAGGLTEEVQARWRQQALVWLLADLEVLQGEAEKNQNSASPARQMLVRWQQDPALAGVRDADGLARLSAVEQEQWHQLWRDVAGVLAKTPAPPKDKP